MTLTKEELTKELEGNKENRLHHILAVELLDIAIKAFEEELKKFK